jgi:hypothetical protein
MPPVQVSEMGRRKKGAEVSEALTFIEKEELKEFEKRIESGLKTFREVGAALLAIRDGRMYRAEHKTFEDYCRERWGFSKSRANQLVSAAEVVGNLTTIVAKPQTESQARPLAALPPEKQPEAWQAATSKAESEGRKVTARDVQEEVKKITTTAEIVDVEVLPPEQKEVREEKTKAKYTPPCNGVQFARLAIMKLSEIQADDTERKQALTLVKEWIHENE